MTKYLITGGAGFIGSNLVKKLLDQGHMVQVRDDLSTGFYKNIGEFLSNPRFSFFNIDVCDFPFRMCFDRIINLASPASPIHYQDLPIKTTITNVVGTNNYLKLAKDTGARFLQASTSEIYGDPIQHPQREEDWGNVNSYGVRSCYDEGKRCAESLVHDYRFKHGVDTRIVRIFNTFGPNLATDDGRVVSNFILQALKGNNITLYGDGSQTRSFCYIDDLIEGMLLVLEGEYQEPLNLGNPTEFTIKELAEEVLSLIPTKSRLVYKSLPKDDPKNRQPNIDKMKQLYGWEPKVALRDGLVKTISYFRELL